MGMRPMVSPRRAHNTVMAAARPGAKDPAAASARCQLVSRDQRQRSARWPGEDGAPAYRPNPQANPDVGLR
jgi:hypothetical protein